MADEDTFEAALNDVMAEIQPHVTHVAGVTGVPRELLTRLATTRLVYADWLEERGDPRAALQRWLVREGKFPRFSGTTWDWWRYGDRPDCNPEDLPAAAWLRLPGEPSEISLDCKEFASRRAAERALYKALILLNLLPS